MFESSIQAQKLTKYFLKIGQRAYWLTNTLPLLKSLLNVEANEFGPVVTHISIQFAPDGISPIRHINLLKKYSTATVEQIKREALKKFETAGGINNLI